MQKVVRRRGRTRRKFFSFSFSAVQFLLRWPVGWSDGSIGWSVRSCSRGEEGIGDVFFYFGWIFTTAVGWREGRWAGIRGGPVGPRTDMHKNSHLEVIAALQVHFAKKSRGFHNEARRSLQRRPIVCHRSPR